ncbi:MAG TPA: hypothetical protein VF541_19030 [Longimicrobium sp.]|jgi:hypothetical protein
MEMKTLDAVAMTRRIREAHYEQLRHVTAEEKIRFYREKARRVHAAIGPDSTPDATRDVY